MLSDIIRAKRLYRQGLELSKSGNALDAIDYFRKALEWYPEHIGARLNMGFLLCRIGQYDGAVSQIKLGIRASFKNTAFICQLKKILGDVLTQAGKYSEAEEAYYEALSAAEDTEIRNKLGALLCKQGRYKDAFEQFKIALNPDEKGPAQNSTNGE